jgi:cardiolipin synthase
MQARWDEETLFFSGDKYFAELLSSIQSATNSVELETYIFHSGKLADRLVAELITTARRGVRVRVMVDGVGSPQFVTDYWPRLKEGGVRIRFYRLIPWVLRRMPGDPQGFFKRMILRWRRMNRGNHRKFALIDRKVMYVGSFNVSDIHLQEVSGQKTWKDLGVRVAGKDLKYARRAFDRAFRGWTAFNLPARSPKLLLLNDSFLHKRRTRHQHLIHLRSARERIWLATPYFLPIGSVFRRLVRQARRGVDVRIMIPKENDVFFMNWISLPLIHKLAKKGVKVFVYQPRFAHQKLFIADDWMCLGSTNLNHRSFLHDLEMDVVISHPDNKTRLENNYLTDLKASEPLSRSDLSQLSLWQRVLASLFIVLKYWA